MSRLKALTLVSALLLIINPIAAIGGDRLHNLVRRGEHNRMIKRYAGSQRVRGILDVIDPSGEPAVNAGENPTGENPNSPTPAQPTDNDQTTGGILDTIIGGHNTPPGDGIHTPPPPITATTETTTTTTTTTTVTNTTKLPTETSTPPPPVTPAPTRGTTTSAPATTLTSIVLTDPTTKETQEQINANRQHQSTLSRIPNNVRLILIVVGSCLVGLAIIWTIVRKWKFRSSRSFQDRLAPIDWQPDADKEKVRLGGANGTGEIGSDNASIRRNMFAPDDSASSLAPPAHDFTAGAAAYGRSPSPLPNPYARTMSPAPYRTASPATVGLQRYPSNSSGRTARDATRGY